MALVEIVDLTKQFSLPTTNEVVRALDGVSLAIEQGELVGLVGESGCGKTTLGRCIVRLTNASSGTIRFQGNEITGVEGSRLQELRQKMQIVFQDPFASLDPRWRIYEILEEPLRIHNIVPPKERRAEVARLLNDVGLPEEAAFRYPHEFSGGQRQRIGIARALALRPEFLIADEPVSALDVSIRAQILNLLRDLQHSRGITILFIGHDLAVVRQICNRVAVMYRGKIVEIGKADEIFENPRHPYTRALLDSIPSISNIGRHAHGLSLTSSETLSTGFVNGCKYVQRCVLAREICREQEPPLADSGSGEDHLSACHFSRELPIYAPLTGSVTA